jgi:hypothetical protein
MRCWPGPASPQQMRLGGTSAGTTWCASCSNFCLAFLAPWAMAAPNFRPCSAAQESCFRQTIRMRVGHNEAETIVEVDCRSLSGHVDVMGCSILRGQCSGLRSTLCVCRCDGVLDTPGSVQRVAFNFVCMQVRWGARYSGLGPEGHRWFTSVLVHTSAAHILSNTLVFVTLATYLEAKMGTLRIAGVGTPPCTQHRLHASCLCFGDACCDALTVSCPSRCTAS